jgi:hypothetical protein
MRATSRDEGDASDPAPVAGRPYRAPFHGAGTEYPVQTDPSK